MQQIVDQFAGNDPAAEIARRLLLPYLNHAATMYESGYATRDDIDASMRFGCGYPFGPLALVDEIGAAAVASALDKLYVETGDELHQPVSILSAMANDGTSFAEAVGADDDDEPELRHEISTIGVVGTGTMATGIVEVFAKAGYDVVYVGRGEDKIAEVLTTITKSLDKAISRDKLDEDGKSSILARLSGSTTRDALADVDLVVEAIAEDLDIKLELFRDLDRICKPGAILATTTSSLSINDCAAATSRPQNVIGMHFFNPAPIMRLVEVVSADQTFPEVAETVRALCLSTGKHPVSCGDRAGFIVNALLFPYLNDAVKLHEAGGGTLKEIDEAMKATALPMGPFQLLDVVGNDVSLAIQKTLVVAFGHAGWQPAPMLERLVAEGNLGRKTGAGFYTY